MIKRVAQLLALAGAAFCQPSFSETTEAIVSGSDILTYCESGDALDEAYCLGFVAAAYDSYTFIKGLEDSGGVYFLSMSDICAPNSVTTRQLADSLVKTLSSVPEHRFYPAVMLAPLAWSDAFPCAD